MKRTLLIAPVILLAATGCGAADAIADRTVSGMIQGSWSCMYQETNGDEIGEQEYYQAEVGDRDWTIKMLDGEGGEPGAEIEGIWEADATSLTVETTRVVDEGEDETRWYYDEGTVEALRLPVQITDGLDTTIKWWASEDVVGLEDEDRPLGLKVADGLVTIVVREEDEHYDTLTCSRD